MAKTITKTVGDAYETIASGDEYTTATLQVRGMVPGEVAVDERTEEARAAAGDKYGLVYQPLQLTQFSDWVGEIRVRSPYKGQSATFVVILS